ncbi:MAG: SseB family protein [Paracoccaceae bacterium]
MQETGLDRAYQALVDQDDAMDARMAFFGLLADSELFLVLMAQSDGATAAPMVIETSDGAYALAFDSEERLAEFAAVPMDYASMAGRRVAVLLAEAGLGLSLNPGVSPCEAAFPHEVMAWLAEATQSQNQRAEARMTALAPPGALPDILLQVLDSRLANMAGVASAAWLAQASYDDGSQQHVLAMVDVPAMAQPGVAEALGSALRFAALEAGSLDIVFLEPDDPRLLVFARVGLGFEVPALVLPEPPKARAPGSDPDKPPRLR